ncbi:MAG: hypothetical protein IJT68_07680 [Lentisphaeria bacterium]|nr:hypothetical protein [Lentisphaeria bacterium]
MTSIETTDDGNIVVRIQMSLRNYSGRKKLIIVDGEFDATKIMTQEDGDKPVLLSLARAHHWKKLMDEGKCKSTFDIAYKLTIDPGYVRRLLSLNNLSPKIVRRFLDGTQPDGLSLSKLLEPQPYSWEEQEKKLLGC